jgi:hypothetical protein
MTKRLRSDYWPCSINGVFLRLGIKINSLRPAPQPAEALVLPKASIPPAGHCHPTSLLTSSQVSQAAPL